MIKLLKKFLLPLVLLFCTVTVSFASWITTQTSTVEIGLPETTEGLKKVAYLASDKNTFYTSIEKAVEVANDKSGGDTVYVIPGTNPTITRRFVVDSDVTLIFPFEGEIYNADSTTEGDAYVQAEREHNESIIANTITIQDGVATKANPIVINGTLIIGAINSYGTPSTYLLNCLAGKTCVLNMGSSNHIQVNGNIKAYGKITNTNDSSSIVVNNGGRILNQLWIYDWPGGGTAIEYYGIFNNENRIFPFSKFDLPQIDVPMTFEYGGVMSANARVNAAGMFVEKNDGVDIIGHADNSFVKLSSGSSLLFNFDLINGATKIGTSLVNHTTDIELSEGTFNFGVISVNVSVYNISTNTASLPIPYGFNVIIKGSSTLNCDKSVYFANGSSIEAESGATVYMDATNSEARNKGIVFMDGCEVLVNSTNITMGGPVAGFLKSETIGSKITTLSNLTGVSASNNYVYSSSSASACGVKIGLANGCSNTTISGYYYSIPESRMVPTKFEPGTTYTYENQYENANPAWGLHDVIKYSVTVNDEAGDAGNVNGYTESFYVTPEGTSTKTTLKITLKDGYRQWYIYRFNYYVYTIEISGSVDSILWDDNSEALSRDGKARNEGDLTAELTIYGSVKITFRSKKTS